MNALLIYTTPEKLQHKQGKLKDDEDHSSTGDYYWQVSSMPRKPVKRIYFATQGKIRGYFRIDGIEDGQILFNAQTWKSVDGKEQKAFQGYKYIEVE